MSFNLDPRASVPSIIHISLTLTFGCRAGVSRLHALRNEFDTFNKEGTMVPNAAAFGNWFLWDGAGDFTSDDNFRGLFLANRLLKQIA